MPTTSHLVSGKIFDLLGDALSGATVSLKHTTLDETIPSVTSNAQGEYILNLSKLSSQWSDGDEIQVTASKTAEGTKTVTTTIQGAGGQTVNLTLAETSDFAYDTLVQNRTHLFMAMPVHYDGEKVTRTRPLPVQAPIDIDLVFNPAHAWTITRSDLQPDDETVTLANGDQYKRTFTYNSDDAMIARSKWEKQ